MDKPYLVVFTGEIVPNTDVSTVKSNIVLSMGMAEYKVNALFDKGEVVLKRFDKMAAAQKLVDMFYETGAICIVRDTRLESTNPGTEVGSESSLMHMLKQITGSALRHAAKKKRA